MQTINNFLAKHYGKIKALLVVLILGTLIASGYLFITRPQHKVTPETAEPTLSQTNPITKKLPYVDPYYSINYKTIHSGKDIIITIHTVSPRYRYYAIKQFYAMGYDPTDFKIEYPEYKSPLGN